MSSEAEDKKANWNYIGEGFYHVRTQAGFKQAVKHYYGRDSETNQAIKEMQGYPRSYPSICTFTIKYAGYQYIKATCIAVNKLLDGIAAQENT